MLMAEIIAKHIKCPLKRSAVLYTDCLNCSHMAQIQVTNGGAQTECIHGLKTIFLYGFTQSEDKKCE